LVNTEARLEWGCCNDGCAVSHICERFLRRNNAKKVFGLGMDGVYCLKKKEILNDLGRIHGTRKPD
jgi:hypothetical protein